MSSSKVRKAVEEYFRSMNSITEKLIEDVQLTSKDEGWGLFINEEQSASQWRKLIDPCLEEKYRQTTEDKTPSCFPVLLVNSGEKLIIDEDTSNGRPFGSSWKDEHSAPFSWETKSQLNLHLLFDESGDNVDGQQNTPKTPPSARSFIKISTPKVTPRPSPKPSPALTRKSIKVPPEQLLLAKPKMIPSLHVETPIEKADHNKKVEPPSEDATRKVSANDSTEPPAVPPRKREAPSPPVPKAAPEMPEEPLEADTTDFELDTETPTKGIPKTGFDFLDNW